jgi:nitrogen fixation protein FixH
MRLLKLNDTHPLTGWHVLAIVGLFFGTIIGVNVVLAVAATGSFPGLVAENSYVASQRYNALLAEARRQDAVGWRHELAVEDGVLRFSLATQAGTPATGLDVVAHAGRPSTAHQDRVVTFAGVEAGGYVANVRLPAGRWAVDIEAWLNGERLFRRTQDVFVKPAGDAS